MVDYVVTGVWKSCAQFQSIHVIPMLYLRSYAVDFEQFIGADMRDMIVFSLTQIFSTTAIFEFAYLLIAGVHQTLYLIQKLFKH